MKSIRIGMFETNSSSSHVITFPSRSSPMATIPSSVIAVGDGDYGWSGYPCETPNELLDYCLVAAKESHMTQPKYRAARDKAIRYFADRNVELKIPEKLKEMTGYIDHQSGPNEDDACAMLAKFIENPEALFNFIFSRDSRIVIDNDNH